MKIIIRLCHGLLFKIKNENAMRKIYILVIIVGQLLLSCVEDSTVTSFKQLNEVVIGGLENSYEFNLFEETNVIPTITTLNNNESNLEYRWYMYNVNHRYEADTLSREKDLKVIMGGTPGLPYTLVFKVIDVTTGVFYSKSMNVQIVGELTKGTMFLCENDGIVDVNFMKPDSTILRSIYRAANPNDVIEGNPLKLFFVNPNASSPLIMKHVYITGEEPEGGVIVDPISFKKISSLKNSFHVTPQYPILRATLYFKGSLADYIFINGKLFNRAANMADPLWKTELLITALDQPRDYDLASLLIFPTGSPIVYDNKYGRFLQHTPENMGVIYAFTGGAKTAFDYNNSGLSMLYCAQTTLPVGDEGRYGFAITRDTNNNDRFLIKYLIGKRGDDSKVSVYADEKMEITYIKNPGLYSSDIFASDFNSMPGVLWYANGGKLYSINTFDSNPTEVLQKDFSLEGIVINQIKFFSYNRVDPVTEGEVSVTEMRLSVSDTNHSSRNAGMIYMRGNIIGGINVTETSRVMGIADKIFDFEEKLN